MHSPRGKPKAPTKEGSSCFYLLRASSCVTPHLERRSTPSTLVQPGTLGYSRRARLHNGNV
jgi:hypothetical protein